MNSNKQTVLKPKKPIPEFSSLEEEAEFWETHDFTDFYNFEDFKLNDPNIKFAKNLEAIYRGEDFLVDEQPLQSMHVRLPRAIIEGLKKQAKRRGIGASTLLRMMTIDNFCRTI